MRSEADQYPRPRPPAWGTVPYIGSLIPYVWRFCHRSRTANRIFAIRRFTAGKVCFGSRKRAKCAPLVAVASLIRFLFGARDRSIPLSEFAGCLVSPSDCFSLFAGLPLRGLFVSPSPFHFSKDAFTLHLLFQYSKRLVDVVGAYSNVLDCSDACACRRLRPRHHSVTRAGVEVKDWSIAARDHRCASFRPLLIGANGVLYLGLLAAKGGQNLWISHCQRVTKVYADCWRGNRYLPRFRIRDQWEPRHLVPPVCRGSHAFSIAESAPIIGEKGTSWLVFVLFYHLRHCRLCFHP